MKYSKGTVKGRKRSSTTGEKAITALMVGAVTLIVLAKLAFLALIGWGIFELVTWVTSK
jgi:hypothetical protein